MAGALIISGAQAAALGVYMFDAALPEFFERGISLEGRRLTWSCTLDELRDELIAAENSADLGDGMTPDGCARRSIECVLKKLRRYPADT